VTALHLVGAVVLAGAAGVGVGVLARPGEGDRRARPRAVEAVLRAYERRDEADLRAAQEAAGDPARYESPWREELRFVRAAAARDWEALEGLGYDGPRAAPAARALRLLAESHPDDARRARARARFARDFPHSWAARGRGP
jgi:hypothetical protein